MVIDTVEDGVEDDETGSEDGGLRWGKVDVVDNVDAVDNVDRDGDVEVSGTFFASVRSLSPVLASIGLDSRELLLDSPSTISVSTSTATLMSG